MPDLRCAPPPPRPPCPFRAMTAVWSSTLSPRQLSDLDGAVIAAACRQPTTHAETETGDLSPQDAYGKEARLPGRRPHGFGLFGPARRSQ
ncbi:hypothetical protein GCM10023235_06940 [Kitasatospora terrestris]|uniref:Uncharacterized protein n=1 Tax=Kitasatospora terrestris TaxID=258051 RepID=A0ABP9DCR8_9ACTN